MRAWRALMWIPAAALVLPLMGCDDHDTVVYRERPAQEVVVVEEPGYVVVQEAPPAVYVERRSASPGVGYVWLDGYWYLHNHKYVWMRGHWDRPPGEHYIWYPPRYEHGDRGYRYVPGRWGEGPRGGGHEGGDRGRPGGDRGREGGDRGHEGGREGGRGGR